MSEPTLLIASQHCAPFTQQGAWSLFTEQISLNLRKCNHKAAIALPYHSSVGAKEFTSLRSTGVFVNARHEGHMMKAEILKCKEPGHCQILFLKSPVFEKNENTFLFYSNLILELAKRMEPQIQQLLLLGWELAPTACFCQDQQIPFSSRLCLWGSPGTGLFDLDGLDPSRDLVAAGLAAAERVYLTEELPAPAMDPRFFALPLPNVGITNQNQRIRIAIRGGRFSCLLPILDQLMHRGAEIIIEGEITDPKLIRFFRNTQERFPEQLSAMPYGAGRSDVALFLPDTPWSMPQIEQLRKQGTKIVTCFYGESLFDAKHEGCHYFNNTSEAILDCLSKIFDAYEAQRASLKTALGWQEIARKLTEPFSSPKRNGRQSN